MHRILGWFLIFLTAALPAAAQLPTTQVSGGLLGPLSPPTSSGPLTLPIALPGIPLATLTLGFEQGIGLNLLNLGYGAWLVSPNDPGLLARLPPGVKIAPELPLLIRIEPPPSGGLSFSGIALFDIAALTLVPSAVPSRRLYAAPTGGPFIDITEQIKFSAVYRVLGSRGKFSEFLVVEDPTPVDQAITAKLDRLSQILADHAGAIPAPVHAELAAHLAALQAHRAQDDTAAALDDLERFLATVEEHSGSGIPDVWRAARDLVNVAGELRAAARTLRFSLRQDLGS